MKPFTYERVTDPRAAGAAASRAGAKFISGGTNLLDLMKLEIEQPTHLVDISRLPLKEVEDLPDGGIRIGAQAANSEVAADPRVRARYPALAEALLSGGLANYETRPQSGAISCNAHAARISTTPQQRATNGLREQVARHFRASIVYTRSSAQVTPASPAIRPTWPSRCRRWKRRLNCWSRTSPPAV